MKGQIFLAWYVHNRGVHAGKVTGICFIISPRATVAELVVKTVFVIIMNCFPGACHVRRVV